VDIKIYPTPLSGNIQCPPSKSISQRALIASLLHRGESILHNFGNSADENATLKAIQSLGAEVIRKENTLHINSNGIKPLGNIITVGESGFTARVLTSIIGAIDEEIIIEGTGSLLRRNMSFFSNELTKLGIQVQDTDGKFPVKIKGPAKLQPITVDAHGSSQYISGLLFLFAYCSNDAKTIIVTNLVSCPYIDMTIAVIHAFRLAQINKESTNTYTISPWNEATQEKIEYTIENDWSNAALLLCAASFNQGLTISGLSDASIQGDRQILDYLISAGGSLVWKDNVISIQGNLNKSFSVDLSDQPDLFPPLAMLAMACPGTSEIAGVHRLKDKESDRAESIRKAIRCMGGMIEIRNDSMLINGPQHLLGGVVNPHNDHRIAMMTGLLATAAEYPTILLNADCINKSYPTFWKSMEGAGAHIEYM